jgi:hypothetical protein
MKNKTHLTLFVLFITLININSFAQSNFFAGAYFTRTYVPEEYNSASQVWCAAQDSRGIMFFGTATDMLTFDGNVWKKYKIRNEKYIRSMDTDNNGKIYIGSIGEFGYFDTDSVGEYKYQSISANLHRRNKNFI